MKVGGLLLLLLIGIGFYLYLQADSAQKTLTAAKPARATAEEVSGVGMKDSFVTETIDRDGKAYSLKITKLDKDGPLAKMYDLKVGDEIIKVGAEDVRNDAGLAESLLLESGLRQNVLTILRKGQRIELTNHGAASGKTARDRMPGGDLNPLNVP